MVRQIKNNILALFVLLLAVPAYAQTYISAQSHKQATATSQTITSDAAGSAVDVTGFSAVLVTVRGTYVVVSIDFQASPDATNYFPIACARVDSSVVETGSGALTNTTRAWRCNVTGFTRFRHNSDWTSGTVNVTITPVAAASDLGVTVGQATAANLNATVTGTVNSAQSGTWTVQPGNTANTTAWKVDGSAVTQPVSAASLPLPSGAATSAKQPALGTAGSASADVLSVQGVASMTALKVDGSAVTQPVSGTLGITANSSVNVNQVGGTAVDTNSGTKSAGTQRIVLATDQPQLTNALKVDGSATTQPVSGTVTANAGTGSFTVAQSTAASLKMEPAGNVASAATDSGNPIKTGGVFNTAQPTVTNGQRVDSQSTARGAQIVATGADTFNVTVNSALPAGSNTVGNVNAIQSGTWTVQPGNTANTTAWKVDGSAVTQPVSGTVTANAGTGTFTVSGTVTANAGTNLNTSALALESGGNLATIAGAVRAEDAASADAHTGIGALAVRKATPANTSGADGDYEFLQMSAGRLWVDASGKTLTVDGSGVTQPISAASLPLPSGAATAAKQPALGTAGSASADVITVQGVASMTALKVDGSAVTQPVSGTVGITANSSVNVNQLAGTTTDTNSGSKSAGTLRVVLATDQPQLTNKLLVTPDANSAVNVAQINGVATTMGNGVSGTGVQRVTIASDSTGQVTLAAGANTIGALTANQSVNVNQIAGSSVSTAATGIQKVGISGATGVAVDGTVAAGSAPTNQVVTGGVYNTSAPAPTNGQTLAKQLDQAGNLRTTLGMATATLSGWTSATSVNTTQNIFTNSGVPGVLVHLVQGTTISGGAITFEVTYDNSNWITIGADQVIDPTSTSLATVSLPYTLVASTNKGFLILSKGAQGLRIKLSTAITGSATVTPNYALLPYTPVQLDSVTQATASNLNAQVVGSVANGATDAGNPLKTGGTANNAFPTAVTNGQRVNEFYDLNGRAVTSPYTNPENMVVGVTSAITDTTSTSTIAAQGSGVRTYITSILVTNSHATVGTFVKILDGSTIVWEGWAAAAGGGFSQSFSVPLRGTANTAVNCQAVTTGANFICSIAGYKAP